MRVFWTGVLLTGLILVGMSTYDSLTAPAEGVGVTTSSAEDGTGFPPPKP
jgi:hypothetical protein